MTTCSFGGPFELLFLFKLHVYIFLYIVRYITALKKVHYLIMKAQLTTKKTFLTQFVICEVFLEAIHRGNRF